LVGIESSDDAAVYRINDELAIIQTLDFFTPVVDDPYVFGQIAAANSLSDIYAMGGEPKLALNIVCFPDCLDPEVLTQIMKGGHDKVTEAGAILVGGHSVSDDEPKYGLSVTGFVHPEKVQANNNAKAGDLLVLTKPLGIGIITTAIKGELASENARDKAILSMSTLNSYGKMALDATENVHSVTDITGFGLLGHSLEMAEGSGVTIKIYGRSVPYIQDKIKIDESIPEYLRDILYDPQTSGGLLISVARGNVDQLLEGLSNSPVEFGVVGEVMPKEEKQLIVE
jgi:selenide,water dikinase